MAVVERGCEMVARGTFDDSIRAELRGRGNVNRGDAQQEARDRAARSANVRSGKNPNPRTSTAYKPTAPKSPRKSKGGGGGGGSRKGTPTPRNRPGDAPSGLPGEAPIPGQRPGGDLPVADAPGMEPLIMSLLLQRLIAQKGAGGAGPDMPPQDFEPMYKNDVPSKSVQLTRVPNDVDMPQLGAPRDTGGLSYDPQLALPPPSAAAAETPDNFAVNRFFDQGEIAHMQDAMPGIRNSPGWGIPKMPLGPFKRVIP